MGVNKSIDITRQQHSIISHLLKLFIPNTLVWAYGSRVKWTARPNSDLDLVAFCSDSQQNQLAQLIEAFEQSDLPFRVDLFNWAYVPDKFKAQIKANYVVMQQQNDDTSWPIVALTEIYDIHSGLSKSAKFFGSGYPFLAFKDVFKHYFVPDELSQLVQSSDKEREKTSVKRGDVFLTRTSETMHELGLSCVALKDYPNATFNGFTKRLRPKDGVEIVPEYVGYYLRSPKFRREMLAFSTMSTRASLNNDMIGRLTIALPSVKQQYAIGIVLKTLDDKITLNNQINQTLEQMAQALFKSWFVDFDPVIDNALAAGNSMPEALQAKAKQRQQLLADGNNKRLPDEIQKLFPSEFVQSELGWLPAGWDVKPIGEVIENVGGGTPRTKENSYWVNGEHAFCTPKDMSALTSKILMNTARHLTDAGVAKISSGILPEGTVLMSSRAPIGYLAINAIPATINQGIIAMKPTKSISSEYLISWAVENMKEVIARANGSTFLEISKKNFREIPFLIPHDSLLALFDEHVKPYFQRIGNIQKQTNTLTTLRDTLLPKLISGEITIPEAEKQVDGALT